jgi:hypothetical protein
MSDLTEKKKQPPRYPMGTIKQARNTLSRLTRDLLNDKIDKDKYRAACYGLSVLCGLFKIETPEQKDIDIKIGKPDWINEMSPEERKEKTDDLKREIIPYYDRYIELAEEWKRQDHEKVVRESNERRERAILEGKIARGEIILGGETPLELPINEQAENIEPPIKEPTKANVKIGDTEAAWRPCGIGAKTR